MKLAVEYDLVPTGGSDFHGYLKPHISIGTGRGDLYVPYKVLEEMKKLAEKKEGLSHMSKKFEMVGNILLYLLVFIISQFLLRILQCLCFLF